MNDIRHGKFSSFVEKNSGNALYACIILVVITLATGTFIEKARGTEYVQKQLYHSLYFLILWASAFLFSGIFLYYRRKKLRFWHWTMYGGALLIFWGAICTRYTRTSGEITLSKGETARVYVDSQRRLHTLPFPVTLKEFQENERSATICFGNSREPIQISPNHIAKLKSYRFYLKSCNSNKYVIISVVRDKWGIGLTYGGFTSLLLSFLCLFFDPESHFRKTNRKRFTKTAVLLFISLFGMQNTQADNLKNCVLSKESAEKLGDLYIFHNGRICPLQTFALDFTNQLYGSSTYQGLTAEQVLSGWLFYYDDWHTSSSREVPSDLTNRLRIYPVQDTLGQTIWHSANDSLSERMLSESESLFIRKGLTYAQLLIENQQYSSFDTLLDKLKIFQQKRAKELPSDSIFQLEKIHHRIAPSRRLASIWIFAGILLLCCSRFFRKNERALSSLTKIRIILLSLSSCYLLFLFITRWIIMKYVPLSNGYETMLFLSLTISTVSLFSSQKKALLSSGGLLMTGIVLIAALADSSHSTVASIPLILKSPLLLMHVAVLMFAYALFLFTLALSAIALGIHHFKKESENEIVKLQNTSLSITYIALFFLITGIVLGSVWANISWGNYWSWDPKEVWALITIIIYGTALLAFKEEKKALPYHRYILFSFFSIIITYFGVSLYLGGIHSYL